MRCARTWRTLLLSPLVQAYSQSVVFSSSALARCCDTRVRTRTRLPVTCKGRAESGAAHVHGACCISDSGGRRDYALGSQHMARPGFGMQQVDGFRQRPFSYQLDNSSPMYQTEWQAPRSAISCQNVRAQSIAGASMGSADIPAPACASAPSARPWKGRGPEHAPSPETPTCTCNAVPACKACQQQQQAASGATWIIARHRVQHALELV